MLMSALHVVRRNLPFLRLYTYIPVPHVVQIRTMRIKVRFKVLTTLDLSQKAEEQS